MGKTLFTADQRQVLREATYEADAAARAEANIVWDGVIAYIAAEAQESPPFQGLRRHPGTKGFAITAHNVRQMPGHMTVVLAPANKNTRAALAHTVRGRPAVVLYGVLQGPFHTQYLDIRIKGPGYRKDFVHEYVHYLDELRNPTAQAVGIQGDRAQRAGDRAAYLRTPVEFNAWFQGTAQEIEDAVDRELSDIRAKAAHPVRRKFAIKMLGNLREHFATFQNFLTWVERLSADTPDVFGHLKGTKWERKWLKRMHGLYKGLRAEVRAAGLEA